MGLMDQKSEGLPGYKHIERNEFSYRKHKKQKEEDIPICLCRYKPDDPDSACGDRCLNVLTSTECTRGYCPCDFYCKNQRFQKCEYPKFKLFKTEGRGWGLLADQDIKAGEFIIEYCGEVISWKEARRRSQAYEAKGLKDAYIISLNASESIDATRKGSLARFINHSCEPNCETRKWTVLGEIRVGIFAKKDILAGTELAYDYNFEWYGGAKVRCLCGAACCSEFLGAKSRGFQEATYLWEDDDDRYSVENIPLYDSEEDEPTSKLVKTEDTTDNTGSADGKNDDSFTKESDFESEQSTKSLVIDAQPITSVPMVDTVMDDKGKIEIIKDSKNYSPETHQNFGHKNVIISRIRSSNAWRNYRIESSPSSNKGQAHYSAGRSKHPPKNQVTANDVARLLPSKEAEEVLAYEDARKLAASNLDSLYDQIRPAIEEHERDSQDSVSTSVAEKWIEACCGKLKAEFDFHFSVIKHISSVSHPVQDQATPKVEGLENPA